MGNDTRATRRVTPAAITSTTTRALAPARGEETRLVLPALHHHPFAVRFARVAILATSDLASLILAGGLAYAIWAWPAKGQSIAIYLELVPLTALFLLGYAKAELYPGLGLGPVETLRRQSYVTAFGYLVLAAFTFAMKLPHLYSRVTFVVAFALSLLLVPCARTLVVGAARRWSWWGEPVVIVGAGDRAVHAIRNIQHRRLGYTPLAVLAAHGASLSLPGRDRFAADHVEGVPVVGGFEAASQLAARGIRVALMTTGSIQDRSTVDELQRHFRHVVLLRDYDDLPVEGIQIRSLGSLVGIEYTNNLLLPGNRAVKRSVDVLVAGAALLLALPLIAVAVVLVRLTDGSPIFFSQSRSGIGGRRIKVPKIRTMKPDAERQLVTFLSANAGMRQEWEARHKLRDDPRLIAGIGRLFRRFSVDELPQLWSVLRGDMSLVGPRPFPDYHLAKFSPPFRELRQRVRPGITGLWQVEIRSEGSIAEQEAFDSYYIRNWSVWLDLYVLARTVAAVFAGRGAY